MVNETIKQIEVALKEATEFEVGEMLYGAALIAACGQALGILKRIADEEQKSPAGNLHLPPLSIYEQMETYTTCITFSDFEEMRQYVEDRLATKQPEDDSVGAD